MIASEEGGRYHTPLASGSGQAMQEEVGRRATREQQSCPWDSLNNDALAFCPSGGL
jgi:hypothetical protein